MPGSILDPILDPDLECDNADFWDALLDRISADDPGVRIERVLDIGCHRGGLLELIARRWSPIAVFGVEPIASARSVAKARLSPMAEEVEFVSPDEWAAVPAASFDLITCHEVLYLIEKIEPLMTLVAARLSRGGRAYFVLGCHAENPIWRSWRPKLESMGHTVYDHRPLDVLRAGSHCGLRPAVRPLRSDGWAKYDPLRADFTFPSVSSLLEHHFRQKLVFRFVKT